MRLAVVLTVVLALGACSNRVISYQPLMTRDRVAEASIKRGVWGSPDPGCVYEREARLETWPACANAMVVDGHSFTKREFLAAGEPLIIQSRFQRERKAAPHYGYTALSPTARDDRARVTAFDLWFVACGPPDVQGEGDERTTRVTRTPLPGLTIEDENCVATTPEAVRNAARVSRAWSFMGSASWMRPLRRSDRRPEASGWSVDPLARTSLAEPAPAAPASPRGS